MGSPGGSSTRGSTGRGWKMGLLAVFGALSFACSAAGQIFRLPDTRACENRIIHAERFNKAYHFSWLEEGKDKKWDWEGARNYCRKFCMDSISINSRAEANWVKQLQDKQNLHYIWTGGRKCNFKGCDRKDLQPTIENGWYWAPTGKRIPSPKKCRYCDWSKTGGLRRPQPDNREFKQGGNDEGCIGILNNVYKDGIKWHDIECRHKKPVICQESDELPVFYLIWPRLKVTISSH